MKISTTHKGISLTGVVLAHSPHFLEVAITSPVSKLITSRSIPYFARQHRRFEGEYYRVTCEALLIELYECLSGVHLANSSSDRDAEPTRADQSTSGIEIEIQESHS